MLTNTNVVARRMSTAILTPRLATVSVQLDFRSGGPGTPDTFERPDMARERTLAGLVWAGGALVLAAALAAQSPKPMPRGLPPSKMQYPLEWEFKTPPPRGTVTPGSACEVAEEYVRQVNFQRPAMGLSELFADDAELLQDRGRLLKGRAAIHAFYSTTDGGRAVIPVAFIDSGAECYMEIAIQRYGPDETFRLAGTRHFTVNPEGRISRLVFFSYGSGGAAANAAGSPGRGRER